MEFQVKKRLLTVPEYHQMIEAGILGEGDRVELINGEIVHISPKGTQHASCLARIVELLFAALGGKVTIRIQDPIICGKFSEPEPDVVLARRVSDHYESAHPGPEDVLVVMEISDSSLAFDQTTKLTLYAEAGIPEYWIFNLPEKTLEVYQEPKGAHYAFRRIYTRAEEVPLPMGEKLVLSQTFS